MIKEKTTEEIIQHKAKVLALYASTGKELYKKIADACQEELDLRAKGGQKKTEEPKPTPQLKPIQAERKPDPQPKPEKQDQPQRQESQEVEHFELNGGVRGGKTQQVREWFELNGVTPAPKETPKSPAKVHREFLPGLFIEEPASLGELQVSKEDNEKTTLDIPMVNGTVLRATYGIAGARARYYFGRVLFTDDFTEKRYEAVLRSAMFRNVVRLVRGWGRLKSLDMQKPDYPTLTDIFKIQRQTREDRINQATILYKMVMQQVESKDRE